MAINYPGSLDDFTNPAAGNTLDSPSHSGQHSDLNDAVEALEAKVGITASPAGSAESGQLLMADGSGGSSWATTGVAFKNLIINGAMQVAQRGTSVTGITSGGYLTLDRWPFFVNTQGTWTMTQENDAPTGSGFRKSLKVLCTTADSSPAAGDYLILPQRFEGQNLQAIKKGTANAEQLTLSFWVKSNVTGTYIVSLYDNDNTRAVSASYSVASSGTWEKKTIIFPADTTGVLDNDNNDSLSVNFYLGAGTDRTSGTLATTWESYTAANAAVGQTNLASATNNYWQITGVQLEVGAVATPFEFKPYAQELIECQRYYFQLVNGASQPFGSGFNYSASDALGFFSFPTTMRTGPSITVVTGTNYYAFRRNGADDTCNSISGIESTISTLTFRNNTEISGTAGHGGYWLSYNASASIGVSAEL